jgi:hypothetical protein
MPNLSFVIHHNFSQWFSDRIFKFFYSITNPRYTKQELLSFRVPLFNIKKMNLRWGKTQCIKGIFNYERNLVGAFFVQIRKAKIIENILGIQIQIKGIQARLVHSFAD